MAQKRPASVGIEAVAAPLVDPTPEPDLGHPDTRPTDAPDQPAHVPDQPLPEPERPMPAPEPEHEATSARDPRPTPTPAPARSLDPKVADLLRAEAAFEAEARRREGAGLEMQPDLGLLGNAPWPPRANPDPSSAAPDLPAQASATSSRGAQALPDIDQISSSLEPASQPRGGIDGSFVLPQSAAERQRSFLKGFTLPLALAGLMVGLYLLAPTISSTIPALAGPIQAYAALVDGLRAAIVGLLGG